VALSKWVNSQLNKRKNNLEFCSSLKTENHRILSGILENTNPKLQKKLIKFK
jgi:hypothetical protein